jgi:integrase
VRRKIDYLFQRKGSANWYVRLQSPGNRTEKSLGTSDRREAEILAGPLVTAHKAALLAARPRFVTARWHEYEPGRKHVGPDGAEIIATNDQLIYLDATGNVVRTAPNGALQYSFPTRLKEPSFELFDRERAGTAPKKNGDDELIETYLKHRNVVGAYAREARDTWGLYQSLVGKPLKDASRDDGRKLVAHFEAQELKSGTVAKKISWLTAAVNLAIKEGKLKFNPFSSIVPKRDDKLRRLPFDANDIDCIKRNLNRLSASDQLLVRMVASTGMRLSEAFEIKSEFLEGGVRYVEVGHKTEQSLRRVPLPADVLPFLPARIEAPLFQRDARASKTLNKFLDDIGITDPRKVIHSFRHRAADRLRAAKCPKDIRYELLGHEIKTIADDYGEGYPVSELREWIDKIGF